MFRLFRSALRTASAFELRITSRTALVGFTATLLAALVPTASARDFVMPKLVPATEMTFRDFHPQEKLAVGADPYDTSEKAALFHPKMRAHSILPVLVVFTNQADQPVVLNHAHFELVTRDRAKAEPYSLDDLRRALTSVRPPGSRAEDRLPIPLPGRNKAHGGLSQSDRDELERAGFAARAVEPRASQQGFLFFDVGDLDNPAQGARLFVTGVNDAQGHELMYFEIPLGKP
jgi:hypothetical protein